MKAVFRITLLVTSLIVFVALPALAQRVITGTVYREGKPAAGVTVEAHRGKNSMMTSFDGKYKVEADEKTKWLRFTFLDESERMDISDKTGDVFDFAFDGKLPGGEETESADVVLKSAEELIRDQNRDFMNELSLYGEFYKQENYSSAFPHWKNVYNKYPKSTLNIYIHGANMYEKMIEEATTPEEKEKHIDELMKMYDKRIKYFDDNGFVLGRKATAWLKYKLENDRAQENGNMKETLKKGYDWLLESVNERGNESELPVLVLLMQTTRSLFLLGEIPKETVVKNYDLCSSTLKAILEKTEDKQIAEDAVKVQAVIEEIFGASGAADCEALITIFTPQYEENKNDINFIKGMLRRLGSAKCDESQLFSDATEQLYRLEPSAEAAFNMARRYLKRNDDEKTKNYYLEAIEQETDKELLAKYYYEYALFIFAKDHDLQEARRYARQALEAKPNYCDAYILIGDIYVAASRSFGDDDFEKSTVFWVAVDYYERARSNPDCAVQASEKVSTYRNYFPNKEEAFFRSLQDGQTYKVGGWINETTKIRF
jgi:tetratricopeptide (TPR) repeat protein